MTRPTRATIDLTALQQNFSRARQIAANSRIMAVVKANGYGHGIVPTAQALSQADAFGVACSEEALLLREAGIQQPITLLEGFFDADELPAIVTQRLDAVIHHPEQLRMLETARLEQPLRVWLKIDTGMHRLGFPVTKVADAYRRLQALPQVSEVRLLSHLACADAREDPRTMDQLQAFMAGVQEHAGERSIANSGALLGWPETHLDWVRPGLMLYGISPFDDDVAAVHALEPVMTLQTRLIAINRYKQGDAVGYGGAWVCPEDMDVGVAAIGYGDGYPRHAPAGTPVLVDGRTAPLIGRVSMDMICLDLRPCPDARIGSQVTLWGQGLAVELVARQAGTIPYELVCAVASRVPMEYLAAS